MSASPTEVVEVEVEEALEVPAEEDPFCDNGHLRQEHYNYKTDTTEWRCQQCKKEKHAKTYKQATAEKRSQEKDIGNICECGCGRRTVTNKARFIVGHHLKNRHRKGKSGGTLSHMGYVDARLLTEPLTVRCMRCGLVEETTGALAADLYRAHRCTAAA